MPPRRRYSKHTLLSLRPAAAAAAAAVPAAPPGWRAASPPVDIPAPPRPSRSPERSPERSPARSSARSPARGSPARVSPARTPPPSSPPPGFGPVPRPARSPPPPPRIARGPHLPDNFARRVTYHQRALPTCARVSSEIDALFDENPPVCAASPDVSFDEFARRLQLAADAEAGRSADGPCPPAAFAHFRRVPSPEKSPSPVASPVPQHVNHLAKWFTRLPIDTAALPALPEHAVEEPAAAACVDTQPHDQLDDNVLSFFDSIRSQAMADHHQEPEQHLDPQHQTPEPSEAASTFMFGPPDMDEHLHRLHSPPSPAGGPTTQPKLHQSRPDSGVGDLERWFQALASANAME